MNYKEYLYGASESTSTYDQVVIEILSESYEQSLSRKYLQRGTLTCSPPQSVKRGSQVWNQDQLKSVSRSVVSNSLQPYGPTWLLCPWDFPGKNPGVGGHSLLQGIFLT